MTKMIRHFENYFFPHWKKERKEPKFFCSLKDVASKAATTYTIASGFLDEFGRYRDISYRNYINGGSDCNSGKCYKGLKDVFNALRQDEQFKVYLDELHELQYELSLHINNLTQLMDKKDSISCFTTGFEKSVQAAEASFKSEPDLYFSVIRPRLMALMGYIVSVLLSPMYPFSSTTREYVATFFKTPTANELRQKLKEVHANIVNDVTQYQDEYELYYDLEATTTIAPQTI